MAYQAYERLRLPVWPGNDLGIPEPAAEEVRKKGRSEGLKDWKEKFFFFKVEDVMNLSLLLINSKDQKLFSAGAVLLFSFLRNRDRSPWSLSDGLLPISP